MATLINHGEDLRISQKEQELVEKFSAQLDGRDPRFTTQDGHNIPEELNQIFVTVMNAISKGLPISVSTMPEEITTTTAASILNVSRPTLMKYINQGKLQSRKVGSHHRLSSREVITFEQRRRKDQRKAVFDMMELDAQEPVAD